MNFFKCTHLHYRNIPLFKASFLILMCIQKNTHAPPFRIRMTFKWASQVKERVLSFYKTADIQIVHQFCCFSHSLCLKLFWYQHVHIFKITTNVRLFTWHGRPLFKSTNILYLSWRETQVVTEQSCSAHHSTSSHLGYTLAFFHRKTMRNWPSGIGKKS